MTPAETAAARAASLPSQAHDMAFTGSIGKTYRESTAAWPQRARAPAGAPNVVCIVLDDVGFADLGCYGSEIATPNIDRLAANGLRYANFHVTAMCSPTRACLLTGRNAHAAGVGIIAEWSSGFPGYRGALTHHASTIAEVLGGQGYGAYAVGKWHLTNIVDYGASGPHDDWPLGRGFGRWYGFHGALADQWHPELYQDNRAVDPPAIEHYHLSEDLVDHAIGDVRDHIAATPDRPFFLYLAFGACHWPHHVPADYLERCRGCYDEGWDTVRAQRLARQLELGIVPAGTALAPRNPGVAPWESLPADAKRVSARLQESYAAFLEHTDAQIGRFVDALARSGHLDDTIIVLMSDNGASAEGGPTGAINLRKHMVYEEELPEVGLARLADIGSDRAFNHYPTGWAQVSNTPLRWYKKDTHGGGIRAPLIIHWPRGIAERGGIRQQFHHVVDIAPTLYAIIGVDAPAILRGLPQLPLHGVNMVYSFEASEAPTPRHTQYFEILGDRALWHDGWKAVARHPKGSDFDADQWELYHLDRDFAEAKDLAVHEPEKLRDLIDRWWTEARRYNVLPLDDRDWERAAARLAMNPRNRYRLDAGSARIDRLGAPDITDRSFRIIARFDAHPKRTEGVLLSWGSRFGGIALFIRDGRVAYRYIYSESLQYPLDAIFDDRPGPHDVRVEFERRGDHAGRATLWVDGRTSGSVDISATWPTHGVTAGLRCGENRGAAVSDEYVAPFCFNGTGLEVVIELDNDGERDPKGRYQAALKEQ